MLEFLELGEDKEVLMLFAGAVLVACEGCKIVVHTVIVFIIGSILIILVIRVLSNLSSLKGIEDTVLYRNFPVV